MGVGYQLKTGSSPTNVIEIEIKYAGCGEKEQPPIRYGFNSSGKIFVAEALTVRAIHGNSS